MYGVWSKEMLKRIYKGHKAGLFSRDVVEGVNCRQTIYLHVHKQELFYIAVTYNLLL